MDYQEYRRRVWGCYTGKAVGGDNPLKLTTAAKVSKAADICRNDSLSASAMAKKLRELF